VNNNIPANLINESLGVSFESPLLSIINYPKSKEERDNKDNYKQKLKEVSDYKIQFIYQLYLWLQKLAKNTILACEEFESYDLIEEDKTDFTENDNKVKQKKDDRNNSKEKEEEEVVEIKDRQRFSQKDFLKMGQQEKVKLLISQLTQFHNVENKVTLIDKNYVELNLANNVSNLNCLNNIFPIKQQKQQKKHFITYKINNFDESKIIKGDRIKVIGEKTYAKVRSNDGKEITLEFSKEYKICKISIVRQNNIVFDKIVDELYKVHNKINLDLPYIGLNKCLYDFLMKKEPDFTNGYFRKDDSDELGANVIEEGTNAISNLNNSFLIIQGPPGTGKSYTSSHIIINLIKKAKLENRPIKIGVSSNSHKAIDGLLLKIRQESLALGEKIEIYKYHSKTNDNTELYDNEIYDIADINSQQSIVGGTVFNMFKEQLDYLFIDEAGQVSLANLVVMASQTSNLILIGDQQQLEQPIQGIHAGDSGKSVLEYYLEGVSVVPFRKGFFLPISRRMCKDLCETVSSFFYNGQLFSEEDLYEIEEKEFIFPLQLKLGDNHLKIKDRGVQFIEVDHKNNLSSSDEEVLKIKEIVNYLLTQKIQEKGQDRLVVLNDIIIVSPFNSQVNKIAKAIPLCNTGSVDLFQGQEAPIVIYSLAASDPSSRGTEFLLNPNRTNVALSRGKLLAIIVGSKEVLNSKPTTIEELKLLNMYSKLVKY
jgi:superfamily I DNA and/or RNA helicase